MLKFFEWFWGFVLRLYYFIFRIDPTKKTNNPQIKNEKHLPTYEELREKRNKYYSQNNLLPKSQPTTKKQPKTEKQGTKKSGSLKGDHKTNKNKKNNNSDNNDNGNASLDNLKEKQQEGQNKKNHFHDKKTQQNKANHNNKKKPKPKNYDWEFTVLMKVFEVEFLSQKKRARGDQKNRNFTISYKQYQQLPKLQKYFEQNLESFEENELESFVDQILIEVFESQNKINVFNYLSQCYERSRDELAKLASMNQKTKQKVIKELWKARSVLIKKINELIITYYRTALLRPCIFSGKASSLEKLGESLIKNSGVYFIKKLIKNPEIGGYDKEIALTIVEELRNYIISTPFYPNSLAGLKKMLMVTNINTLANTVVDLSNFIPKILLDPKCFLKSGVLNSQYLTNNNIKVNLEIEHNSFLGPILFKSTILNKKIIDYLFEIRQTKGKYHYPNEINNLKQSIVTPYTQNLYTLVMNFIKRPKTGNKFWEWVLYVLKANRIRSQMAYELEMESSQDGCSDSFIYNFCFILFKMSKEISVNSQNNEIENIIDYKLFQKENPLFFNFSDEPMLSPIEITDHKWISNDKLAKYQGNQNLLKRLRRQKSRQYTLEKEDVIITEEIENNHQKIETTEKKEEEEEEEKEKEKEKEKEEEIEKETKIETEKEKEIKLEMTKQTKKEIEKKKKLEFNTYTFFSTIRSIQFGLKPLLQNYEKLRRQYSQEKKLGIVDGNGTPFLLEKLISYELSIIEEDFINSFFNYCNLLNTWILKKAIPNINIQEIFTHQFEIRLPLIHNVPKDFHTIPEFFINSTSSIMLFYINNFTKYIKSVNFIPVFNFYLTLFCSPRFIKSPFTRSKMLNVIYSLIRNNLVSPKSNELSIRYLMFSLLMFYIEVEYTGSNNQVFDRLHLRTANITMVSSLLDLAVYQRQFNEECENHELLLRFAHFLVNDFDSIFNQAFEISIKIVQLVKDEKKFKKEIDSTQSIIIKRQLQSQFVEIKNYRKNQERHLSGLHSILPLYFDFLSKLIAKTDFKEILVSKEIINSLVSCINFNLINLFDFVTENEFKINNLLQLFDYNIFIVRFVEISLLLEKSHFFVQSVANDTHCYDHAKFLKILDLLKTKKSYKSKLFPNFKKYINNIEKIKQQEKLKTQKIQDNQVTVPDRFLCELTYEIMANPVKLPNGTIVEKAAINHHLLNDPTDPYTRLPLTIEDVEDCIQLKNEISEWKKKNKYL
ncbi:ubiquitination factor e4 [Anaeramoeba flamelloides]|uniref:Ubiquitination factor e4 n=1 Tax=Anaeramoeba flamelloides TaxID=1746091 RepID=A0AAV7ZMA4_9EUKA|nr:ubiquitination factor e4 [Anaeramoeba flamelloides]